MSIILLIVSVFINVFFAISLYIDRLVLEAMTDEILQAEDRIEFLEGQVVVQQDAMLAAHPNQLNLSL